MFADNVPSPARMAAALASGEIHLWLASYANAHDPSLHRTYMELLDLAERAQERRFFFSRDRRRYLVTRALVRTVLSRYAPVKAKEWNFSSNPYGRPEIANDAANDARLSFNVSHAHGLIVLAVAAQRAVGVDVENAVSREAPLDIADRYFAPAEVTALAQVPAAKQRERFFEYWTFKESYIKARGMGLSLPLDKFSFHFPDERSVCLSVQAELDDDATRWQFWQLRPVPHYLVALCAERLAAGPANVTVRWVTPMVSEEALDPTIVRTSLLEGVEGTSSWFHDPMWKDAKNRLGAGFCSRSICTSRVELPSGE